MTNKELDHIKMLAIDDFEEACLWAENNIDSLKEFFDTWASHCGASRETFIGHTIAMLLGDSKNTLEQIYGPLTPYKRRTPRTNST